MYRKIQGRLKIASHVVVSGTWQATSMIKVVQVGRISWRACRHAMSSHGCRCV